MALLSFATPGATTWTVPAGISTPTVTVRMWGPGGGGGAGGNAPSLGGVGGGGQYQEFEISVVAGEVYQLFVGNPGSGGTVVGGWISGGAGGGGSATTFSDPASNLIAAAAGGGGGGGGDNSSSTAGGFGGGAGSGTGGSSSSATGGTGATPTTTGSGGSSLDSNGQTGTAGGNGADGVADFNGGSGSGGSGGAGPTGLTPAGEYSGGSGGSGSTNGYAGGGGGGGGRFRGGGGSGSSAGAAGGGGGGGGGGLAGATNPATVESTGQSAANSGSGYYPGGGVGEGGAAGANVVTGSAGGPGFILIEFDDGTAAITSISAGSSDLAVPARPNGTLTITGSNFGASKGTSRVLLGSSSDFATATLVEASTSSWADNTIEVSSLNLGSLTQGPLFLYIERDAGESNAFSIFVSSPHVLSEIGTATLAAGTGSQILYTPTISPVKAYMVIQSGATSLDTIETNSAFGVSFVTADDAFTAIAANTDGSTASAREQQLNAEGTLNVFADGTDLASDVLGTLSIDGQGRLVANVASSDDQPYQFTVVAFGGRTLRAVMRNMTHGNGSIDNLPFPNDPALAFATSADTINGDNSAPALFTFGAFTPSASWGMAFNSNDLPSQAGVLRENVFQMQIVGSSTDWSAANPTYSAGSSQGRRLNWTTGTGNADQFSCLFLWLDTAEAAVGSFQLSSTAVAVNQDLPAFGFEPTMLGLVSANNTSQTQTGGSLFGISLGVTDGTTTLSENFSNNDNGSTFISRRVRSTSLMELSNDLSVQVDEDVTLVDLVDPPTIQITPAATSLAAWAGYWGIREIPDAEEPVQPLESIAVFLGANF